MADRAFSFLFALALGSLPASALTFVHVADVNLAKQADVIATVEVIDTTVAASARRISSKVTMLVEELIKGETDGAFLTVRIPGGFSEELGVEVRYDGAPEFGTGERALVFLRPNSDGTFRVLHFALGAFWQKAVGEAPVFVRHLPEPADDSGSALRTESTAGAFPSSARSIEVGRDAERFVAWLRDEVAGSHREADYLVALPERKGFVAAPFTIFEKLRAWTEFHRTPPQKVTFKRHKVGQDGVPKKGKPELKKIFKVLNNSPDSEGGTDGLVNLALKGTFKTSGVPAIAGACVTDNVFVFDDAADLIDEAYSCTSGGVLAVGGACRFTRPRGSWKGQTLFAAVSGRVVFNSGTGCYYKSARGTGGDTPANRFSEVAIHEILHTLGLRHACGDSSSPDCSDSAVLDDATMRASVHRDGRGAQLRDDDLFGFWQLYDPNFFAAPCHLPPGHKRFCKECGPCGEGQGVCKKNRQCLDGLRCRNDSALGFKTCS